MGWVRLLQAAYALITALSQFTNQGACWQQGSVASRRIIIIVDHRGDLLMTDMPSFGTRQRPWRLSRKATSMGIASGGFLALHIDEVLHIGTSKHLIDLDSADHRGGKRWGTG